MMKFDQTGAFLVADMDRELYVKIPGYKSLMAKRCFLRRHCTADAAAERYMLKRSGLS